MPPPCAPLDGEYPGHMWMIATTQRHADNLRPRGILNAGPRGHRLSVYVDTQELSLLRFLNISCTYTEANEK